MIDFAEKDGAIIFSVRVITRAANSEIVGESDGVIKVRLVAPPVDGAANAELIETLAKFFKVSKSAVEILKGQASRTKRVKINGATIANLPDIKTA